MNFFNTADYAQQIISLSERKQAIMVRLLPILIFIFFCPLDVFSDDEPAYEEISVFLNVAGLGGTEIEAVIVGENAFLSVTELFNFLKIKNRTSSDLDSINGFFLEENMTYTIESSKNQITLGPKVFKLESNDLIKTPMGLYLKSGVFGKVFGLHCTFNFRSLSVQLLTQLDLPAIREKRLELMRANASKLKREIIADTIVRRRYAGFNAGTFDWFLSSTQQKGNQESRLAMKIGTVVLGGETNFSLNYDSQRRLSLREQQYQWRYVDNDERLFKQITLGKISPLTTASVFVPVLGIRISNTPTTYRRSFDTYTFSDFTQPDWKVELYVNNVLLDYVKADAAGFFTFRIPLLYGNSSVKLRFFGPWGEERISEKTITVPYNFLPGGEMEYNFAAGILEDGRQSRYSRADLKYGLTKGITVGTGAEYISSVSSGMPLPFVNSSLRLASNLLLTADYMYNVRAKTLLNYSLPSNFLVELDYIRYRNGQTVINGGVLEERKAMFSKQIRLNRFSGFSRLSFNQLIYPGTRQTIADLLISGAVKGVSASLSTFASVMSHSQLNVLSNLAMTFQIPSKITVRTQMQYSYRYENVNEIRFELEKQLFSRGLLNLEYSNNLNYKTQNLSLGLRFDLNFSRVSIAARQSQSRFIFSQSFSGGLIHDSKMGQTNFNNRSNVGRGGLVIYPFLDINANNKRDLTEPKIEGLQIKINGGRTQKNLVDTTIQVLDLEPYASYLLELNTSGFDNIAWELKKHDYQVTIEPNTIKMIEVPVKVSGEISGMIYAKNDDHKGQGRILINFFRNGKPAGRTLSETDGYFSYLGLPPGAYTAEVDSAQLSKLEASAKPASFSFNIAPLLEGDVVSEVEFKLQEADYLRPPFINLEPARAANIFITARESRPVALKAIKFPDNRERRAVHKPARTLIYNFLIIANAFGDKSQAVLIQKTLSDRYGYPVRITPSGSLSYQLVIEGFETKEEANIILPELSIYGFRGLYVTQVRKKIVQPKTSPAGALSSSTRDDAIYFSIVVELATDEAGIKAQQEHILKVLRLTSYPIKQQGVYKLIITGFPTMRAAEIAYQKLLNAGVSSAYIATYKKNFKQ